MSEHTGPHHNEVGPSIPAGHIETFLRRAIAMSEALSELHSRRQVHRDVKPLHFRHDETTGRAQLIGTELAVAVDALEKTCTGPGCDDEATLVGSLPYMAPEQTGRVDRPVDTRSDLYSLGVSFFEMLTGELPFDSDDPLELIHHHIAEAAPAAINRHPDIPRTISAIVRQLMAKNPDERYQTAEGLRADLERCLDEWRRTGKIDPFVLGTEDIEGELHIPDKLYGRGAAHRALVECVEHVETTGDALISVVAGGPGIGKSALIDQFQPHARRLGLFASGKFDQYLRNMPYLTLIEAFRQLVQQILTGSEEELNAWRHRLQEALGETGGVVAEVIPEIRHIVGEQPEVPALSPAASQNRLNLTFERFVQAFARPHRPLVLFLDDMQWADGATLALLEVILTRFGVDNLHLILAYRDNEVDAAHPFARLLRKLEAEGPSIQQIELGPLDEAQVNRLVEETFESSLDHTAALSRLVYHQTEGNPFFVRQLLESLFERGLVTYDPGRREWTWREEQIEASGLTEDIVDLMVTRLERLGRPVQHALQHAACIGSKFDLETLAVVSATPRDRIRAQLDESLEQGLISRVPRRESRAGSKTFRFQHDRIQQAAYSMVAPPDRPALHLEIGRLMLANTPPEQRSEQIFDIVDQLNKAVELLDDAAEREQLIELDLMAADKARASSAFATAAMLFEQAAELMGDEAWHARFSQIFEVHLERAECEYLAGDFDTAERILADLLPRCRTELDRADVYIVWLSLHQKAGQYSHGFAMGLQALATLGMAYPDEDTELAARIEARHDHIERQLAGRNIDELADAPLVDDERIARILALLSETAIFSYFVRPALFPLLVFELVSVSLRHGNSPRSCYGYSTYALVLIWMYGEVDEAVAFSEMSQRLDHNLGDASREGWMGHLHGNHILIWKRPFAEAADVLEEAFDTCVLTGDFVHSNYIAFTKWWVRLESGATLDELQETSSRLVQFARQTGNRAVEQAIRIEQQAEDALLGRTDARGKLEAEGFDSDEALAVFTKNGFGTGTALYWTARMLVHNIFGQTDAAFEAARRAETYAAATMALTLQVSYVFQRALALSAAYGQVEVAKDKAAILAQLREAADTLEAWSSNCPDNFEAKWALVSAELAQLQGENETAARLYERAAQRAAQFEAPHDEAIACERAAAFYEGSGLATAAHGFLKRSCQAYLRWGATDKVRQLTERYPAMFGDDVSEGDKRRIRAEGLDLMAAMKASQAISAELEVSKLTETLMPLLIEHAGAERGCLVLLDESGFSIEAEISMGAGVERAPFGAHDGEFDTTAGVPESILRYVRRTGEHVLLDDARRSEMFASDEYIATQQPKSVLCLPVARQDDGGGTLYGMLYLENNLTAGAFSAHRLRILELMAAQTAVSLENASLYREAQLLSDARRYVSQLKKLNEIAIAVNSALSLDEVADIVTQRVRELIGAHQAVTSLTVDQAWGQAINSVSLSDKYARWRDYDVAPTGKGIYRLVCETNKAMRLTQAKLTEHPAWKGFSEHADTHPPIRGWLAAPLIGHDGTNLGLLQLSDKYEGEFTERDEAILVQLAQLIAVHVENAKLYEDVQREVHTREELLAVVSHDLRSPLSTITLSAELLDMAAASGNTDTVAERAEVIKRNAEHMDRLINDLLDLGAIDTGTFTLEKTPCNAELLVDEALETHTPKARRQNLTLDQDVADHLPPIECDHDRIQQIFANLIGNAIKFTPSGGRITVGAAPHPTGVRFSVSDTGPGVREDELAKIFDSYWQAEKTARMGVGLGLSIAKGLVAAHGGDIWVESELGEGTTFFFTLPSVAS